MLANYFTFLRSKSSRNYLVLPNKENPRILTSLKNFILFKRGLELHNTASLKNRLLKKLILIYYFFIRLSKKNIIAYTREIDEILKAISKTLNAPTIQISSFYIGTPDNLNRKITGQICDSGNKPIGLLKIPLCKKSSEYIENEYSSLKKIGHLKLERILLPHYFFKFEANQLSLLYEEYIFHDSKSIKLKFNRILLYAAIELAQKTIKLEKSDYFFNLTTVLSELAIPRELYDMLLTNMEILESEKIPSIIIHGDFVKYNMRIRGEKVLLVDWEFSRVGLPLFDLFHFVYQGNLQISKKSIPNCLETVVSKKNIEYYNEYLKILQIKTSLVKPLLILYLFDSLAYESKLKPQIQIINSNYYNGLIYFI